MDEIIHKCVRCHSNDSIFNCNDCGENKFFCKSCDEHLHSFEKTKNHFRTMIYKSTKKEISNLNNNCKDSNTFYNFNKTTLLDQNHLDYDCSSTR